MFSDFVDAFEDHEIYPLPPRRFVLIHAQPSVPYKYLTTVYMVACNIEACGHGDTKHHSAIDSDNQLVQTPSDPF